MVIKIKKYIPENTFIKTMICGQPGSGKAQPLSSKILTPNGWTTMWELSIWDVIIGGDGKETKVMWVFPQWKQDIYEITLEDGGKTRCTLDHLWYVTCTKNEEASKVISLKEIIENPINKIKNRKMNYYIPTVKAIERESMDYVVHPYVIWVILWDWQFDWATPMLHTEDYILDKVDDLIPGDMVVNRRIKISDWVWAASIKNKVYKKEGNVIAKTLSWYGLLNKRSYEKFIPEVYKNWSIQQRLELLQWLFDTGWSPIRRKGEAKTWTIEYSTTSETLKNDVCEILNSLWIKYSVTERKRTITRKNYRIYIKYKSGFELFTLPRKNILQETCYKHVRLITSITKVGSEEVQCIKVDNEDELYVTDDYIVTHNTTLASTLSKPLFICTENGLLSIADKKPMMIQIESVNDLRETLTYLKNQLSLDKDKRDFDFNAIVIDSISAMADVIKNKITDNGSKQMKIQDWGKLGDELMGIFSQFITLPTNVVMLCHIKEELDQETEVLMYNPALLGRAKDEVLRYFDIIAYIFMQKDGSRVVTAKENYRTKAKCRSQALAKLDQLPFDLQQWLKVMKEWTTVGTAEVIKEVEASTLPPISDERFLVAVDAIKKNKTSRKVLESKFQLTEQQIAVLEEQKIV